MDAGPINYEALAGSIRAEDIASDDENAALLRRIMNNDPAADALHFCPVEEREDESDHCYCPANAREMGWLGYFVGKNTCIEHLYVPQYLANDVLQPFCRGVSKNKSISSLSVYGFEGGDLLRIMGLFIKNNCGLTHFHADECNFGADGCRQLTLALGSCTSGSLKTVSLTNCEINGEQFADIAVALSMHPNLENLELYGNNIGRNGCKALATLLQFSATKLRFLDLDNNGLDDVAVEALVPALANCEKLVSLDLANNASITDTGWRALAGLLESPNCCLNDLSMRGVHIGDEGVMALVSGLARNQSLQILSFGNTVNNVAGQCRTALSTLLYDTSSVNATFLSNHTLRHISGSMNEVESLLAINRGGATKKAIGMLKILKHHEDLDMRPFFEWDLKFLPLAIDWLARAEAILDDATRRNIPARKLSAIYQFVRGMPLVYVESRLRVQLGEIRGKELKIEQEQLKLEMQMQELERRRREVKESKQSVMARLSN
ncbi:hypothetical protein ACHAXT_004582 [Thalassiosira profunda]